jgi:hypothetical protein
MLCPLEWRHFRCNQFLQWLPISYYPKRRKKVFCFEKKCMNISRRARTNAILLDVSVIDIVVTVTCLRLKKENKNEIRQYDKIYWILWYVQCTTSP